MIDNNRTYMYIAAAIQALFDLAVFSIGLTLGYDLLQSLGILYIVRFILDFSITFAKGFIKGWGISTSKG